MSNMQSKENTLIHFEFRTKIIVLPVLETTVVGKLLFDAVGIVVIGVFLVVPK